MTANSQVVYVKGDTNVEVQKREVTVGDILSVECGDSSISARVRSIIILKFPEEGNRRCVISVLRVIEKIHKSIPGVTIETMGAPDMIVTYEEPEKNHPVFHVLKIIAVVIVTFIGSGFSIMAFHNDISLNSLFGQVYEQFTGRASNGYTILELTYSIGLVIGIIVFFNHFAGKKFSVDPTPMEVEMRLYENDIQTTLMEAYRRKGQEIDVGDTEYVSNHRS